MTRPHIDRLANVGSNEDGTYSLKVGRRVPDGGVNLAYVSSPKISLNENVSLVDNTDDIVENVVSKNNSSERIMVSNENFILMDKYSRSNVETDNVVVTDEFSIYKDKASSVKPLYYVMKLPNCFYTDDARSLTKYISGYNPNPVNLGEEFLYTDQLLYLGSKIEITESDGTPLDSDKVFKIKLIAAEGININDIGRVFNVYIYTNFKNGNGKTYIVKYPSYNTTSRVIAENTTNIFNAIDIFEERGVAYIQNILDNQTEDNIQENVFAIVGNDDYYNIYAPSKMITATEKSRPPIRFRYRVIGNLKAKYDEFNPHTIKVGIIYEENQPIAESVADVLCGDLIRGDIGLPPYVSIENPHPTGNYYRYDPNYWKTDLNMPAEQFLDYDIIILTGYGTVDLSMYSKKLHMFLDNGGKLIVDNLTNENTGRFKPIINDSTYSIMDIGCNSTSTPMEGALVAGEDTSIFNEYYRISEAQYNEIRYSENGVQVSSEIIFGSSDSIDNWTTILKYADEKPAVLYKKYNDRGTIFFSNCGILRKYRSNTASVGIAYFITNLFMSFAEDYYVTTPWIYDNVYHRDNLFQQEYELNGKTIYIDDVSNFDSNVVVAKKILAPTTRSSILPYVAPSLYNASGTFYVKYESGGNIQMTSGVNDGSEMLYVYAVDPSPYSYTPLEAGYKESDIKIQNEDVEFDYTIKAYTYAWGINDDGKPEFIEILGAEQSFKKVISRADGVVNLGPLTSQLPPLQRGELWADTSRIFFKLTFTQHSNGSVPSYDSKVNIGVYDKRLGKYCYNNNAECVIPYNYLYSYRTITTRATNGTEIITSGIIANDLIVQAWTDHYTISAKARTFAVKLQESKGRIYLELPRYTDERERWNVKIHNGGFNKTRYTQIDYQTYVRLMKYRYASDVLPIIEAPVFPNKIFEYSTRPQFDLQGFNGPSPLRKSLDERAEFINEFCIGINNTPLYISNFVIEGETLIQVGLVSYKSNNGAWVDSEGVTVYGESSPGTYVVIEPSNYTIDYRKGMIDFTAEQSYLSIKVSYTCTNLRIIRRKYTNQLVRAELLKRQSDSRTLIASHRNIATYPSPKLFKFNDNNETVYKKETYNIDYKNGVIKTIDVIDGDLYLDYTYYEDELLIPTDYDIENGYIYLVDQINFTDEIYVTYAYEEQFLHYSGYYDGEIFHHLDLNPSEGHMLTYKVVDNVDKPVYKLVPTSKVINKPIFLYMLPHKTTDIASGNVAINNNCIRHCFGEEEMAMIKYITPEAITLGVVQVKESSKVEDSIVLDTRVRGGGLKTKFTQQEIDRIQPLSNNYWDMSSWDGIAYQSQGVTTIKIPRYVLKEYGGRLTKGEIEKIVGKYTAYGTYQIIEYYDKE
jgi:hypothetical protein